MKEPEIKLFGMKITLLENDGVFSGDEFADERSVGDYSDGSLKVYSEEDEGRANFGLKHEQVIEEDQETGDFYESEPLNKDENPGPVNESHSTNSSSEMDDNLKTPSIKEVEVSEDYSNNTKEQNDPQQKTLKKPDKILPCPRCNSMDTKFCYYNNYNVNQPRHFCKKCQRYWTAGGMMRNVPVGAGRRKNKNSTSHFGHITISALTKFDAPNGFHHASFRPNGTVLSFGPDSPVCESMALNLTEKQIPNAVINVDDYSLQSSVTMPNSTSSGGKNGLNQPIMQNAGVPSTVPFLPGGGWSFPWNSAIPIPAICPPGHPMPFYPTPYWNCGVPNAWNVPWLPVPSPTTITQGATVFNPNSPLGKHSRNGELLKSNNPDRKEDSDLKHSESSIVIPKTLRFDDPEEAAKSSIWSTLGIKYDLISREGLFKALQPKGEEKKTMGTGSPVLQANPASLSRSINFQERA